MKENKQNIKRKDVLYASLVDWIVGRSLKSESYYYSSLSRFYFRRQNIAFVPEAIFLCKLCRTDSVLLA